jgi:hypothetical protein
MLAVVVLRRVGTVVILVLQEPNGEWRCSTIQADFGAIASPGLACSLSTCRVPTFRTS